MGRAVKTREQAKKTFFSWLYDEKKKDEKLEEFYKRDKVREKFFKNGKVTTPFGNTMNTDYHHALSYLIQGTTAEMVLRQAIRIDEFLRDKKSFIAFTVHDSVIIDMSKEETHLITKLTSLFADTDLGFFRVNTSFGKDFGNLKGVTE